MKNKIMTNLNRVTRLLLFLFLVFNLKLPTIVAQQDHAISQDSLRKLGNVVEQYVEKGLAIGAELQVIQDEKVLYHKSFGLSDRDSERVWKNDTVCNIRSMTKPITSAAAQILIDRGSLKLDEPVATYLASFDNKKSKTITVRQVLAHRSGLPLTNLTISPYQFKSLEDQVADIGKKGPQFEPGSKFWYSDIGTDVVGSLVETVSGKPLNEFVKSEILDPLAMKNTFYGIDKTDKRLDHVASPYMKGGKDGWTQFWKPGGRPLYPFAWGSQTIYSTTSDYALFLNMLVNGGRVGNRQLLSKAAVERMLEPISRTKGMGSDTSAPTGFHDVESWYGQMMISYRPIGNKEKPPIAISHSGSDGTIAWSWPDRNLTILYFTQSRGGFTPLRIEGSIDRLILHPGKSFAEDVPERLQPYVGRFIANHGNFDNEHFTVLVKNAKLVLDVPSQLPFELLDPDEDGKWSFAIAPKQINVSFDRNDKGEVIALNLHKSGKTFNVPKLGTAAAKSKLAAKASNEKGETTTWSGTLDAGRKTFRLEFDVTRDGEKISGKGRSLDQDNQEYAISEIQSNGKVLSFSIPEHEAEFEGKLSDNGNRAEGTFTQRGNRLPLTLTKSGANAGEAKTKAEKEASAEKSKQKLKAAWVGAVEMGGMRPVMQFRIVELKSGKTKAHFDSVSEGRTGFDATWSIAGNKLKFDVASIRLTYRGELNKGQDQATGTWSQGGRDFPLVVKKQLTELGKDGDQESEADDDAPTESESSTDNVSFEQRLKMLDSLLAKERVKQHIPGFAIAIVKDDKIVFAKGYGYSDLTSKTEVDTETLFAIGSTTKAFTSTLIAMLIDEGKMNWDDPVTKYFPDFKMNVDSGGEPITMRDLLCHRTGFGRMGILWASGELNSDEVVQHARSAEPRAKFRQKFLYSNVMYMLAGRCAGVSVDGNWDALVAERIFKPLNMNGSYTAFFETEMNPPLAAGYLWDKEKLDYVEVPFENLDSIGPSGSIVSNVSDMAQWVRLLLGRGEYNGQRLVSEKQIGETWKKQMRIQGRIYYGFGWMLRKWNRLKVVEHGGSTGGFNAQVTLLPSKNCGYVLLTNINNTPLRQGSIRLVFDTLFGEIKKDKDTQNNEDALVGRDLDELVGDYVGNFSKFNNAAVKVTEQNGKLAVDVPGQQVFELLPPDKTGKWYFAKTNQIAISFNRNKENKVFSVTMHQNGVEPEFVRDDVQLEPESPATETDPLLGTYREKNSDSVLKVVIRNGRLVADAGKSAFTFLPPDKGGEWALRAKPERMHIRFNRDKQNRVKSLTRIQGDRETEMLRVEVLEQAPTSDAPPSDVQKLIAKVQSGYGSIVNAKFEGIRMRGTARFVHQGASGATEMVFSKTGQFVSDLKFKKMARITERFDGQKGFIESNVARNKEVVGRNLNQLRLQHPLWFFNDWNLSYDKIEISGAIEIDGQKTIEVSLSGKQVPTRTLYIASDSGLIIREISVWINETVGDVPVEIHYSDFREVNGIKLPFRSVTKNELLGELVVQYESAESLTEIANSVFTVPIDKNH